MMMAKFISIFACMFVFGSTSSSDACLCGKEGISQRIIYGKQSPPHHFPWIAFIVVEQPNGTNGTCTGSVIGSRWILTAAHCVFPKLDISSTKVYVNHACKDDMVGHGLTAKRVIQHDKYDQFRPSRAHDIALIELSDVLDFDDRFMPICIPEQAVAFTTNDTFSIAGWGDIYEVIKRVKPECLNEADMGFVEVDECRKVEGYGSYDFNKIMCAGGNTNVCHGDSGAPLMSRAGGRVHQVGIASFARSDCGLATRSPAGFERIAVHVDWIREMTSGDVCVV